MKHTRNDFFQEIFDKVSNHLLTQNKRSIRETQCLYRYGNLKCAAGCLIPDSEYDSKMEYKRVSHLNYFYDFGYSIAEIKLIERLQIIHDNHFIYSWKEKLINLANEYSLTVNF